MLADGLHRSLHHTAADPARIDGPGRVLGVPTDCARLGVHLLAAQPRRRRSAVCAMPSGGASASGARAAATDAVRERGEPSRPNGRGTLVAPRDEAAAALSSLATARPRFLDRGKHRRAHAAERGAQHPPAPARRPSTQCLERAAAARFARIPPPLPPHRRQEAAVEQQRIREADAGVRLATVCEASAGADARAGACFGVADGFGGGRAPAGQGAPPRAACPRGG